VFTKTDKLKQADLHKLRVKNPNGIFISNLKKRGIEKLESKIATYLFGENAPVLPEIIYEDEFNIN
jgi:GTP-binding protein